MIETRCFINLGPLIWSAESGDGWLTAHHLTAENKPADLRLVCREVTGAEKERAGQRVDGRLGVLWWCGKVVYVSPLLEILSIILIS